MRPDNLLIVADSEHDANMLYATGMFIPDPFIYLKLDGRDLVVLSNLEINRARRKATGCQVLSLARCQHALRSNHHEPPRFSEVVHHLLREHHVRRIHVPEDFPIGLALELKRLKIKVKVVNGAFFPDREIKTADEVKKISAALTMAEVGLAEAMLALKISKIDRQDRLIYRDVPLTSERLRAIIEVAILKAGGIASHTIVAGGRQGCDPHEIGYGVLRAHRPIIIDIFPRSQKTGYYGDITRTVVKGRASEAVRKLYDTVARAQQLAFSLIRPKMAARDVHLAVTAFFEQEGYKTSMLKKRPRGFFHSTGHGVGLDLHELPHANATSADIFKVGQVMTVEPGLYYPPLGGVRLEDVALVAKDQAHNLTKFEKHLEIT